MPLSRGEAPSVPFFVPTVNLRGGFRQSTPECLSVWRRTKSTSSRVDSAFRADDGQPFPNLVKEGLPTIWKLSRGGSNRNAEKSTNERLAIIRYNYVSIKYVCGLGECQIIGYPMEVATVFRLLHPEALEQESLSCHRHTHGSHIPVAWDNFCLPNFKVASLVQVSQ